MPWVLLLGSGKTTSCSPWNHCMEQLWFVRSEQKDDCGWPKDCSVHCNAETLWIKQPCCFRSSDRMVHSWSSSTRDLQMGHEKSWQWPHEHCRRWLQCSSCAAASIRLFYPTWWDLMKAVFVFLHIMKLLELDSVPCLVSFISLA